jgi:hypothetical protein
MRADPPAGASSASPTLLDDVLPDPDVLSRHAIRIAASPAHVYAVARSFDIERPVVVRALMGIRTLGRHRVHRRAGFTLIAERPGEELVLGLMGRFWTLMPVVVPAPAERFFAPPPAGLAQAVWSFRVTPNGSGTELSTETRVRCGDPEARRRFLRYWRFIRLGSGWIRGSMLRGIRQVAERTAGLDARGGGLDIPSGDRPR